MKNIGLILVVLLSFIGCATYSQLFINADGTIMQCTATGQGIIGMATASNAVDDCKQNMKSAGYIELERAGVVGIQFSESKNDTLIKVLKIFDSSPAQLAGIQPGDKVIIIDGQEINNVQDARHLLFGKAGSIVEIVILRDEEQIPLTLTRAPYKKVYGNPK
jgi:S1-C subfamily serine protease